MATNETVKKQVRSFAFVWTLITFVIGSAVFFAIYLTYNPTDEALAASSQDVALPVDVAQASPVGVTPLSALGGSNQDAEESDDDDDTGEDNGEASQPLPTVEPLPVDTKDEFHVGIQVQQSIDYNPDIQRGWMNDVRGMNLNWFKQQVRWYSIETEPDVYDWTKLDFVMEYAQEFDMNVVLSVVAAPEWAREAGVDLEAEGPPADYGEFAEFMTDMVNRYPGQIAAIEIWNEPNLDREWMSAGGVSAANFVELVQVGTQAIKNIDPGIIVISGAPSPTGGFVDEFGVVRAIDDFDYVDEMIASGLLNYVDCVGVHHNGYNVAPQFTWDATPNDPTALFRGPFDNPHHSWSFRSTLETYANKIAVAGGDQKLCITEFGWATMDGLGEGYPPNFEFALDNTLEEQAEFTVDALTLMQEWDYVWIAIIWNLNYGPQAGWSTQSDNTPYSLIGPDFVKRPAYDAVAQWVAENS